MRKLSVPAVGNLFPWAVKSLAIGVFVVIAGRIADLYWLQTVGGILMAPMLAVLLVAAVLIALCAPLGVFGHILFETNLPKVLRFPVMVVGAVVTLAWWFLIFQVTTGGYFFGGN